MNNKFTAIRKTVVKHEKNYIRFFTETVEAGRISPLAFFEAGELNYRDERFYWQNADDTLTLVGLGHAKVLESSGSEDRFKNISNQWKELCLALIKEDRDMEPVLFGGFSFDPESVKDSVWAKFPSARFVVPSFQLIIKNGQAKVLINLLTTSEDAVHEFDELRNERDRLIHYAQVNEFGSPVKSIVSSIEEQGKELYMEAVEDVTTQIKNGEAEKVVLARSVKLNFKDKVSAVAALQHITSEQQESYHFGLENAGQLFFGATPERLIEVSDGRAYSACVAGSIKRGKTATEDRNLGEELLSDSKNRLEHNYVVNMISNVFSNYCTEIVMPNMPKLMKLRDIQHLFTPIEGKVEIGTDIFSLIEALHPTPALGGVPRDASMAIIREKENMDRGYYAAPIGWVDTKGNGEFAVALRSALLDGNSAFLYAGGGIVADSEPDKEYDETWVKFRPVLRALGGKLNG